MRGLFLLFSLTAVVYLGGCNDNISSRPIKVGVLHNLEQGQSLDAKLSVAAIEIAVAELNQSGGIDGQPIELIIKGTQASQQHFAQQMRELVDVDQVEVVFGCDNQRCVRQSRAVIEHSDALLFYSGDALGGVANERIFNMGALPTQIFPITIDWAHKQFGKRGVVIAQRDAYSKFCYQLAKLQLEALGGELQLMIVEESEHKVSDYAATLSQFDPDIVLNLTTEKLFDVALSAIKQSRTQPAIVSTFRFAVSLLSQSSSLKEMPTAVDEQLPEQKQLLILSEDEQFAGHLVQKWLSNSEVAEPSSLSTMLVVEDNLGAFVSTQRLFKNKPLQLQHVTSAELAIETLASTAVDLLLLDLGLPGMSGFELPEKAKQQGLELRDIIVHTGRELSSNERSLLNSFTEKTIVKSELSMQLLLNEVDQFVGEFFSSGCEVHLNKQVAHAVNEKIESSHLGQQSTATLVSLLPEPAEENIDQVLACLKGKQLLLVDDDVRNTFSLAQVTCILRSLGSSRSGLSATLPINLGIVLLCFKPILV